MLYIYHIIYISYHIIYIIHLEVMTRFIGLGLELLMTYIMIWRKGEDHGKLARENHGTKMEESGSYSWVNLVIPKIRSLFLGHFRTKISFFLVSL